MLPYTPAKHLHPNPICHGEQNINVTFYLVLFIGMGFMHYCIFDYLISEQAI